MTDKKDEILGRYRKLTWGLSNKGDAVVASLDDVHKEYLEFYKRIAKYIDVSKFGKRIERNFLDRFVEKRTALQKIGTSEKNRQEFINFLLVQLGVDFSISRKVDDEGKQKTERNHRLDTLWYIHSARNSRFVVKKNDKGLFQTYDNIRKKFVGPQDKLRLDLEVVVPKNKRDLRKTSSREHHFIIRDKYSKRIVAKPDTLWLSGIRQVGKPKKTESVEKKGTTTVVREVKLTEVRRRVAEVLDVKKKGESWVIYNRERKRYVHTEFKSQPNLRLSKMKGKKPFAVRDKKTGKIVKWVRV